MRYVYVLGSIVLVAGALFWLTRPGRPLGSIGAALLQDAPRIAGANGTPGNTGADGDSWVLKDKAGAPLGAVHLGIFTSKAQDRELMLAWRTPDRGGHTPVYNMLFIEWPRKWGTPATT
jgi:hypothetical protein